MDQVGFSNPGAAAQPSESIWGNCPGSRLIDVGAGYFFHEDFLGGTINFADGVGVGNGSPLEIDADTGTTIANIATIAGGIKALVVSNTDNNAAALFQYPFGALVLNSGQEFWAEARIAIHALGDSDFGFFFGFSANLTRDVIADDVATVAAGLVGDTVLGFTMQKDNVGKVYAVISKDGGGTTTLFSDVTSSTALPSASRAIMADAVFRKLGLRFDGKKTLYFYVDGYQIGKTVLTSTNAGSADLLAPILAIKTGTTTARQLDIDWLRAGYRTRR